MSRAIFRHLLNPCAAINKEKAPRSDAPGGFGPSGATRTPGLLNPNQARYHLRYTRIFSFCYYTTLGAKIKDFPVCGQLCGQSRFSALFRDPVKSRKRPCCKAFRAFAFSLVDSVGTTPKAGALPTALHPDRMGVRFGRPYIICYPDSFCKSLLQPKSDQQQTRKQT